MCRFAGMAVLLPESWHKTDFTGLMSSKPVVSPLGSEEARLCASLRPPLKLHVQFSCMQLSQRFSDAGMREKELNRLVAQVCTRRRADAQAAVSS
jgi:nicotinamidase-related amidase